MDKILDVKKIKTAIPDLIPNDDVGKYISDEIIDQIVPTFDRVIVEGLKNGLRDNSAEDQIDDDYCSAAMPFSLHVTHNDIDAVGCAAVAQLYDNCTNQNYNYIEHVVVMAPAYDPDKYFINAMMVAKYLETSDILGLDWKLYHIYVSDIGCSVECIRAASAIKFKNDDIPFDLVDHHISNPMCDTIEHSLILLQEASKSGSFTFDVPNAWVQSELPLSKIQSIADTSLSSVCDFLHNKLDPDTKIKTSAALLLALKLAIKTRSIFVYDNSHGQVFTFAAVNDNWDEWEHNLITMLFIGLTVSQWDTFSWRDRPELNTGKEFDFVYAQNFYTPYELKDKILDFIVYVPRCNRKLVPGFFMLDDILGDASHYGKLVMEKCLKESIRSAVVLDECEVLKLLCNLTLYQYEAVTDIKIPDYIILLPYPTSNPSLIVEWMTEDELYTSLGDSIIWTIMFDFKDASISVRSKNDANIVRLDKFAKVMGGGGHPQAAGFNNKEFSKAVKITYTSLALKETK